jgi:hypothetical protein
MHRTDGTDNVANLFADPDPGTGRLGTKVDAAIMNAIQEELCNLLEGMGVILVKGTNTQLLAACVAAATASKIVRRDTNGRAKVADPAADDDIDTQGARNAAMNGSAGTIAFIAGWTDSSSVLHKHGGVVTLNLVAQWGTGGSWGTIAFLPVGFRPAALRTFIGEIYDASANVSRLCTVAVYPNGQVMVTTADDGTSLVAPPAAATGDSCVLSCAYHV